MRSKRSKIIILATLPQMSDSFCLLFSFNDFIFIFRALLPKLLNTRKTRSLLSLNWDHGTNDQGSCHLTEADLWCFFQPALLQQRVDQQPKVTPCSTSTATAGITQAGSHLLVSIFMLGEKKKKGSRKNRSLFL